MKKMSDEMENKTTHPQAFEAEVKEEEINVETGEVTEIDKSKGEPIISEIAKEWFEELADGTYLCRTKRDGDFIFDDIPYDQIIKARKRTTRKQADGSEQIDTDKFELAIISESLLKPKLGELEIIKKKSSTVIKLKAAIYKIYDLNSFL